MKSKLLFSTIFLLAGFQAFAMNTGPVMQADGVTPDTTQGWCDTTTGTYNPSERGESDGGACASYFANMNACTALGLTHYWEWDTGTCHKSPNNDGTAAQAVATTDSTNIPPANTTASNLIQGVPVSIAMGKPCSAEQLAEFKTKYAITTPEGLSSDQLTQFEKDVAMKCSHMNHDEQQEQNSEMASLGFGVKRIDQDSLKGSATLATSTVNADGRITTVPTFFSGTDFHCNNTIGAHLDGADNRTLRIAVSKCLNYIKQNRRTRDQALKTIGNFFSESKPAGDKVVEAPTGSGCSGEVVGGACLAPRPDIQEDPSTYLPPEKLNDGRDQQISEEELAKLEALKEQENMEAAALK